VLVAGLDEFERMTTHREPYLTQHDQPLDERRRKLARNVKRRAATLPDELTDAVNTYMQAMHGLENADATGGREKAVSDLSELLAIDELRKSLLVVDGRALLEAYEMAGRALPQTTAQVVVVLNTLILPLLADVQRQRGKSVEGLPDSFNGEAVLADIRQLDGHVIVSPNSPASLLRLVLTALQASVNVKGEGIVEAAAAPLLGLGNTLIGFARQRGYPGSETFTFDVHDASANGGGAAKASPQ
jgi:hypothetical protein